ncbi:MAG: hypothetical protein KY458_10615 [Actinobacteria bacterium]|nr:hypothetical protein [Actinomycetota bacterium]
MLGAAASLLVVRPAPSYDPWAWSLWGRELLHGRLSTAGGPAFKPLPVALSAVLAVLGDAGPWAWVLVARVAAVAAAGLAWRVTARLAGGSRAAGAAGAMAVLFCGHYLWYASSGLAEGLLVALALAAVEAARAGRPRLALALAVGCGLLRVETWPFLVVAAAAVWRRRPQDRPLLVAAAGTIPALWLLPELVGSGDAFRSAARARVPNPGQPALADIPGLASLDAALALPLWPLWVGIALLGWRAWKNDHPAAREALVPLAAGGAWLGLVALMAQVGFSGEPRYALPGAVLISMSGAVGLVIGMPERLRRLPLPAAAAATVLLVAAAAPRTAGLSEVRRSQAYQWGLQSDLRRVIAMAGGVDSVVACGRPYVGRLQGPLLAYHLDVPRSAVEPDRPPQAPGVVFRASRVPTAPPALGVPDGFHHRAVAGRWQVFASC